MNDSEYFIEILDHEDGLSLIKHKGSFERMDGGEHTYTSYYLQKLADEEYIYIGDHEGNLDSFIEALTKAYEKLKNV